MRAQLEPVSSNGGRKIAVFEAQNFDEGRLIIFLFLGKSTLQSLVSYSVTKKIRKKNVILVEYMSIDKLDFVATIIFSSSRLMQSMPCVLRRTCA